MADEEVENVEKKKEPVTLPVRLVGRAGVNATVEWEADGVTRRATIPAKKVKDGAVDAETLEAGVPYGLPLESIKVEITAGDVARELHRAGIWTAEDLFAQAPAAKAAITRACAGIWTELIELSKRSSK
jgi:hypothetical protein